MVANVEIVRNVKYMRLINVYARMTARQIQDLEAGMWRLIAWARYEKKELLFWGTLPLYQLSASDGDGASKYRMALLSTNRKAEQMHENLG